MILGFKFTKPILLIAVIVLLSQRAWAEDKTLKDDKTLKVEIYGYPEDSGELQNILQFNPLQPENLSITTPGLTIAKLGTLGQKTSLRLHSFAASELTLLYDGFEISDPSDPGEGFDLSGLLIMPQFSLTTSQSAQLGLFSRQVGGVLSIDPGLTEKSYVHSAAGSEGQGLLAVQKNLCQKWQCLSLGLGGTLAQGASASSEQSGVQNPLESDQASLGILSLSWFRQMDADRLFKLRLHSQFGSTDIDDYDQNMIFRDDPNANLKTSNHFLGLSFIDKSDQYYFENTYSDRIINNRSDAINSIETDERYKVFRSKLRGTHTLLQNFKSAFSSLNLYWYSQMVQLETSQVNNLNDNPKTTDLAKLELGLQLDQEQKIRTVRGITSFSLNGLEGFKTTYGISQTASHKINISEEQNLILQTKFGYNERRPSLFQLFDPQFGRPNLQNEEQFFLRPEIKWNYLAPKGKIHNISANYFWEYMNSRVVFRNDMATSSMGYQNSGRLSSNSLMLDYQFQSLQTSTRLFFRQSLDEEVTLKSLPWLARQEWGLGQSLRTQILGQTVAFGVDIKWLLGMYNPSAKQIGNLVQSQGSITYQVDTNDRVSLQLNNLFNDKKIWDEGFQRQPFSWMLSLTKVI